MTKLLHILNDLHLGVSRVAGTTPTSQVELQDHNQQRFADMLPSSDLMILGDLFDTFAVPEKELLKTYKILMYWLGYGYNLVLVSGNHDQAKVSTVISSFDCLCSMLQYHFPNTVTVVKDAGMMTPYGYVIPHMPNQDLFDYELSKVPDCAYLYLHCNYDNFFAAQSDNSLNLSKAQADACKAGAIILGHEHNHRVVGKVYIPGCQLTTSVADWVHSGDKYYATVSLAGVQFHKYMEKATMYSEMDWKGAALQDARFVRLSGTATSEEAAKAVNFVAKYRSLSKAYAVANAITVQGSEGLSVDLQQSHESILGFDVKSALYKLLTEAEVKKLEGLK